MRAARVLLAACALGLLPGACCRAGDDPGPGYRGRLIDAMTQWRTKDLKLETILKTLRGAGLDRAAIFARAPDGGLKKPARELLAAKAAGKGFLFLGTPKYFKAGVKISDELAEQLERDLKSGNYSYVSELMLKHTAKTPGNSPDAKAAAVIGLDDPRLDKLLGRIAAADPDMPVQIHFELYNLPGDLVPLEKFLKKHGRTRFVFTHMGFSSPEVVGPLMRKCGNLYVTLSKRITEYNVTADPDRARYVTPPALAPGGELAPGWREFVMEFQDRILFATDANYSFLWQNYGGLIGEARYFLGKFPPEVAEKLAFRNSEKLFRLKPGR